MKTIKEWLAEKMLEETTEPTVTEPTVTEPTVTEPTVTEPTVTTESSLIKELQEVKEQLSKSLELNSRMVHMLEPSNGNDIDINKAFDSFDRYYKKGEK